MEFWFRQKYQLTRHDPRFLESTPAEMLEDYYAHHYFENPKAAENEVIDDEFDMAEELARIEAEAESQEQENDPDDWEDL